MTSQKKIISSLLMENIAEIQNIFSETPDFAAAEILQGRMVTVVD
jgi:hypothetical protein